MLAAIPLILCIIGIIVMIVILRNDDGKDSAKFWGLVGGICGAFLIGGMSALALFSD